LISCSDRRQWRHASIPVPSSPQDGENPLGDGNTIAAREGANMAVWSMRRLQGLLCEESTLFHAKFGADAPSLRTPKITVVATCFAHGSARTR
jgi:hypothetical protein